MPFSCRRAHVVLMPCLIHTCHATTMPFRKRLLKATEQRGKAYVN
jgi:hypothetical protein